MKKITLILLLVILGISTKNALSQQASEKKGTNTVQFLTGVGIGFNHQYEGSDEVFILPGLVLSANWNSGRYIRLAGLGINANIIASKKWEFGPRIGFKLPRNGSIVDNESIASLQEINFSISSGIFIRYNFDKGFDVEANYTHDISGVNDGGLANFDIGYTWRMKRFIHRISINGTYATSNYMNTYFGVNTQNIGTSNLSMYELRGSIKDIGTAFTSTYIINKSWMIVGRIGFKSLVNRVADSPIVLEGTKNQLTGGLILTYKF
jgi:outer membrane protein